jgi:hypothetical protein
VFIDLPAFAPSPPPPSPSLFNFPQEIKVELAALQEEMDEEEEDGSEEEEEAVVWRRGWEGERKVL